MLSDSMNTYLSLRRAVGFKLDTVETYLQSYVDFATSRGDTHVVSTTVIDWATSARSDDARARRLDELIRFARFVRTEDSRHDIPPDHVFCKGRHRRTPYLLSDQEVARLLRETANLGPAGSLRPHTYRTIFGLLASTGLRISEALRLRFDDMTPDGLVIRETKFKKSRLVLLHGTVVEALDSYLERRRRCASADPHIFVSHRGGGRLHYDVVATTFQKVIEAAGIPDQTSGFAPRLHDLRHYSESRIIPHTDLRGLQSPENTRPRAPPIRNNQRVSKKASRRSLGRKRGARTSVVAALASACSFSCMSAWK
jgi:integrase/recombinase XerD